MHNNERSSSKDFIGKGLLKSSGLYVIGEVLSKILPFLIMPYLTRKLGVDGFGEVAYYQAWLAFFVLIISLSQDGAVSRYYYFYGKRSISLIVKCGYIFSVIVFSILLIAGFVFKSQLIYVASSIALTRSILNVQLMIRQCEKKPKLFFFLQVTNSIFSVLFTIIIFEFYETSAVNRMVAIGAANIICVLLSVLYIGRKTNTRKTKFSPRLVKLGFLYLFSYGAPLILHNANLFIKGQFDRVFIYEKFSSSELGVYSAGYQLASIFIMLVFALSRAVTPYFFERLKNKTITSKMIEKWVIQSLILSPLLALLVYLSPDVLFSLFLGEKFLYSKVFTVTFLIGFSLNIAYMILVNLYFYFGKNATVAKTTIISSLVYVIFVYAFAEFSLVYVPFALIISNLFVLVVLYKKMGAFFK